MPVRRAATITADPSFEAALELPISIILVGQEEKLLSELKKYKKAINISVENAREIIGMDEPPTSAVREKADSSINVAVRLVKSKRADAVLSAGNTGALMTAALFGLGRIKGVERPAIATVFPTGTSEILLLDMGANVDSRPKHLKQFAEMGSLYAEHIMHIKNPRVGLLNIGEEEEKGNELTRSAYPMIKGTSVNFIGNVESKEIWIGKVDVVVCDGFVGNLILKFAESVSQFMIKLLRIELSKNLFSKIGAHGREKSRAIKNALRVTSEAVSGHLVEFISQMESKQQAEQKE
ncbi:MAG: phosphate acyltransferase PlsX [Candidatus Saganbacteria bacterium]|nr:phosphate acyltransferase PlsX [Candidatus Saganbacteria bacterium]